VELPAYVRAVRALARDADRVAASLELRKGQRALNVHDYALPAYEAFLERYYSSSEPRVGAIAMNPGKFGAVQTGIPFTDWPRGLELLPDLEKRVDRSVGLPNPNREQSGRRVYAWALQRFGSYDAFFREVLVLLTCPLAVLEGEGTRVTNVPLDQLPRKEGQKCLDLIARHAPKLLAAAEPRAMLLLGAYAEGVWQVLQEKGTAPAIPVARALHPAAHLPDPEWIADVERAWRKLAKARPRA
jgi:single-strand selective monofunctional uracil DNA glycosylase